MLAGQLHCNGLIIMARIRTIKPEFFTSESVLSVSPLARLFFVGLWCEADREGRLKWKPKTLKFRYLPSDDVDIRDLSDELIAEGMIETYTVNGDEFCSIPNFLSHQVINNREKASELPSRVKHASTRVKAEGREGRERKGKERKDSLMTCAPEKLNLDAWQEWLEYKSKIKLKYKTENGEHKKAVELVNLSGGDQETQAMIIKQSIDNEWRGFFALKNKNETPSQSQERKKPRGFGQ